MWFRNRTQETIQDKHMCAWYKLFLDYLWFWNIQVTLHYHIRGMFNEVSQGFGEPTFSPGTFSTLYNLFYNWKKVFSHVRNAYTCGRHGKGMASHREYCRELVTCYHQPRLSWRLAQHLMLPSPPLCIQIPDNLCSPHPGRWDGLPFYL